MRINRLYIIAALCAALGGMSTAAAQAPVRNVILFVGDGMGVSTVTAARIFDGQQRGETGEANVLSFETFPHVALVKTYNVDAQVSDSAGTMTALITGHRARYGMLSVGPQALRGDCEAAQEHALVTLLEEAEQRGLKTGVVSTATITHATPAATYAHSAERGWEADVGVPEEYRATCADIARQFVEFPYGDGVDVALGGGREMFLPAATADPEDGGRSGVREDGRNLVQEWLAGGPNRRFVFDQAGFDALQPSGQVLGLFEASHMEYEADRAADAGGEPSLAEMTRFAIDALDGDTGFLLVVEAGRIDHAHHGTNAYRALMDTVAMADAVAVATAKTEPENTLILVTADHSHTLTISGCPPAGSPIPGVVDAAGRPAMRRHSACPKRGNSILGFVTDTDGEVARDAAGTPYTTLGYANGPGAWRPDGPDEELPPTDPNYRQTATHAMFVETHGGEDVPAYALGVGADGVRGVMDQHELHGVMRAALFDSAAGIAAGGAAAGTPD